MTFSTLTFRSKTGWFGDNGYFTPVANHGFRFAGTNIIYVDGFGGDD